MCNCFNNGAFSAVLCGACWRLFNLLRLYPLGESFSVIMCCETYLVAEFNAFKWAGNKAFIKRDLIFIHNQALRKLPKPQNRAVAKVKQKVSPSMWFRNHAPNRKPAKCMQMIPNMILISFIINRPPLPRQLSILGQCVLIDMALPMNHAQWLILNNHDLGLLVGLMPQVLSVDT